MGVLHMNLLPHSSFFILLVPLRIAPHRHIISTVMFLYLIMYNCFRNHVVSHWFCISPHIMYDGQVHIMELHTVAPIDIGHHVRYNGHFTWPSVVDLYKLHYIMFFKPWTWLGHQLELDSYYTLNNGMWWFFSKFSSKMLTSPWLQVAVNRVNKATWIDVNFCRLFSLIKMVIAICSFCMICLLRLYLMWKPCCWKSSMLLIDVLHPGNFSIHDVDRVIQSSPLNLLIMIANDFTLFSGTKLSPWFKKAFEAKPIADKYQWSLINIKHGITWCNIHWFIIHVWYTKCGITITYTLLVYPWGKLTSRPILSLL